MHCPGNLMAADPPCSLTAELLSLLERERTALCTGQLDEAAKLGKRKLALVARLEHQRPDPLTIGALRQAAQRNARLLAAAAAGLREGGRCLLAIRSTAAGFSTYDRSGRAEHIAGVAVKGLERRA